MKKRGKKKEVKENEYENQRKIKENRLSSPLVGCNPVTNQ